MSKFTDTDRLEFVLQHSEFRVMGCDERRRWTVWDCSNGLTQLGETKPTAREAIDSAMEAYKPKT
jgi:hypothetical protein